MRARLAACVVALLCVAAGGAAAADASGNGEGPPDVAARPPATWTPERSPDAAIREAWERGVALEEQDELLASAALYERVAERHPNRSHAYWRAARNYFRHAESLDPERREARRRWFEQASRWATRGLEVDHDCGECCLYKFSSESRLATTAGALASVTHLEDLAKLLELCLSLPVRHVDNAWNREQANLYYAASSFYRRVPDAFWMQMLGGVRGDPERALELIRRANALSARRVDYQVALGATLLCVGQEQEDEALLAEARRVLGRVDELPTRLSTDALDRSLAEGLLEHPERGCDHSRSGTFDPEALR